MSTEITTHFIRQFTDGITHLAQQKGSRLRRAVSVETGLKGSRVHFDQLTATFATQRTTRHGDTVLTDTPHRRRMLTMSQYDVADLVDEPDVIRVLNDPTNAYSQAMAWAIGRAMDDVIIAHFFATESTGPEGAGTAPFDAAYTIAVGGAGLTIDKVLGAKRRLDAGEEDDGEMRFAAVSARQVEDLLNTTEVSSADFNTVRALAAGQLNSYCGFEFIRTERLLTTGGDRRCPFWVRSAMKLGVGMDTRGRITERPDKNYSTQVFYTAHFGATRMNETGVVDVVCDEP